MKREIKLDALRGICIFGVGIFNLIDITAQFKPSGLLYFLQLYFNDIFWITLSIIFGYSYKLYESQCWTINENKFLSRMKILMILGVLNSFLYYGDILKDYALIGFCLFSMVRYFKNKLNKILLGLMLLEVVLLLIVTNDTASNITFRMYFEKYGLLANIVKSGNLFFFSIYFNTVYHLHMLILVLVGYIYGDKIFKVWTKNYLLYFLLLFVIISCLGLSSPKMIIYAKYFYFVYTNSLVYLFIGLYINFVNFNNKNNLIKIGRNTLTVYFLQNILILCYAIMILNKIWMPWIFFAITVVLVPFMGSRFIKTNGLVERIYKNKAPNQ